MLSRVKLFVCGSTGVGKTELIKSIKCRFLRSLFRRRSDSNLAHMIQQRTHGILVHQLSIPNAGDFSVWDFSGMKSYYPLHEEFLDMKNAVVLVVYKLCDPLENQLAQLRFWLALIKAKQSQSRSIKFAGEREHKPNVVLVASFANVLSPDHGPDLEEYSDPLVSPSLLHPNSSVPRKTNLTDSHPGESRQEAGVLETIRGEFDNYFTFSNRVFQLDCRLSQTSEIKALRHHLGALRCKIIEVSEWGRFNVISSYSLVL